MIHGDSFYLGCDDTGGGAVVVGCTVQRDPDTGPGRPAANVRVTITQDEKTHLLGIRDADADYEIRLETDLPEELTPGIATLRAQGDRGGPAKTEVVIKNPAQSS